MRDQRNGAVAASWAPFDRCKPILKRLLSANLFLPFVQGKRMVFCYHDVSERGSQAHSPLYSTTPRLFRQQIEVLSRLFKWVDLEELTLENRPRRHLAALTFDDGFLSVREMVSPILRSMGIPFTVFVCRLAVEQNFLPVTTRVLVGRRPELKAAFPHLFTGPVGDYDYICPTGDDAAIKDIVRLKEAGLLDDKLYLDAEDIRHLSGEGVAFGSHSSSHRLLAACRAELLDEEIGDNRRFLEQLGVASDHFAIPFGKKVHYTQTVLDALARHGYRYVYTNNPSYLNPGGNVIPQLIPRVSLTCEDPSTLLFYVNRPFLKRMDL